MKSASPSDVTRKPPGPPLDGLSDRHIVMLRLACRGLDPHGVVSHWDHPTLAAPTLIEACLLLSVHCERIARIRQVWTRGMK